MHPETGYCEHCGQPLPPGFVRNPVYGERKPNKVGIGVTIAVHVGLLLLVLLSPSIVQKAGKVGETFVTFEPPKKAAPREQAPKPHKQPEKTQKPVVTMPRLPDTITVPPLKEEPVKEEVKQEVPQEVDMQAYVEARRRQRGVVQETPSESENEKAMRNIKANIARANAASKDDDGTGGVFSITNQTFHGAELKFRGWNPNFKRRWLQQVNVEVGNEPDIETAIIKKMIEIIRREKKGDFDWESHRLNRVVTLSARPQDTEALTAFLFKEMFPKYIPPRRQ